MPGRVVPFLNVHPAPGDQCVGCKHGPSPWHQHGVEFFGFPRPMTFSGIDGAGGFVLDRPVRWYVACAPCAKIIRAANAEGQARLTECLQDLAGFGGVWPANAPPLRLHKTTQEAAPPTGEDLVEQLLFAIRREESGS